MCLPVFEVGLLSSRTFYMRTKMPEALGTSHIVTPASEGRVNSNNLPT